MTVRESPVLTFFTATAAPAMAAPVGSVTVPRIVPRKVCAAALPLKNRTPAKTSVILTAKAVLQVRTHQIITFSCALLDFIHSPRNCALAGTPFETSRDRTAEKIRSATTVVWV